MTQRSRQAIALGACAVLLLLYGVWRATLGITMSDDGYYAAMGLRLAQGARPFTDERFIQSLGFLLTGPFTKVWTAVAGVSSLALGLRLFYVALCAGIGWVVYRATAPSLGSLPAAASVAALLLVPPFNIVGASYNSVGMLGLLGATALAWAAICDGRRIDAVGAVALLALASVSYPPLVAPAGLIFVTMLLMRPERPVIAAAVVTALASVALALLWFWLASSVEAFRSTLEFAGMHRTAGLVFGQLWAGLFVRFWDSVVTMQYAALWVLAAVAAFLPQRRLSAVAEAFMPVAALVPAFQRLRLGGDHRFFGVVGAAFLLGLTAALLVPVAVRAVRDRDTLGLRLLALTAPAGLVGYLVVGYSTQAGWYWGMALVGAAPLVFTVLALSIRRVGEQAGSVVAYATSLSLMALLVALLTVTPFKSPRPWHLTHTVSSGAYAGLRVDTKTAETIAQIEQLGRRNVSEHDTVFIVSGPGAYPLVGGRIYTPSVWFAAGPSSRAAVDYFNEKGSWPDVVFLKPDVVDVGPGDPLVAKLTEDYQRVDQAAGFSVWRRE